MKKYTWTEKVTNENVLTKDEETRPINECFNTSTMRHDESIMKNRITGKRIYVPYSKLTTILNPRF